MPRKTEKPKNDNGGKPIAPAAARPSTGLSGMGRKVPASPSAPDVIPSDLSPAASAKGEARDLAPDA